MTYVYCIGIIYTLSVYAVRNTLNTVYSIQCIELEYVLYIVQVWIQPKYLLIQLQS